MSYRLRLCHHGRNWLVTNIKHSKPDRRKLSSPTHSTDHIFQWRIKSQGQISRIPPLSSTVFSYPKRPVPTPSISYHAPCDHLGQSNFRSLACRGPKSAHVFARPPPREEQKLPCRVLEAMLGNDEQEVRPVSLAELDQIFHTFEHAAARATWNEEGKGVATLDQRAENVKAICRELRKSLLSISMIKENEDQVGAIIRVQGPSRMNVKQNTYIVNIAVHGDGQTPTAGGTSLPERTITLIHDGTVTINCNTTVYLVLLGHGHR